MCGRLTKNEPTDSYSYLARQIAKFMMIYDAFNYPIAAVWREMTGTQQILISHIWYSDYSESIETIVNKNLSQVCSTDEEKPESVIVDESTIDES